MAVVTCKGQMSHLTTIIFLMFQRQEIDGGFQGRPNKISDTCYAFWSVCINLNSVWLSVFFRS